MHQAINRVKYALWHDQGPVFVIDKQNQNDIIIFPDTLSEEEKEEKEEEE